MILFLLFAPFSWASGQGSDVRMLTDLKTIILLGGQTPFWFTANNSGRISQSETSTQDWIHTVLWDYNPRRNWSLSMGSELVVKEDTGNSFVNQLYINLRYKKLLLKMGRESYSIAQHNDLVGLGSLFISRNARPFSRAGIGFYDYTDAPIFKNMFQFKGAFQLGTLDDDRGKLGTEKPWIHEKFLYLKTKGAATHFWVGMNHSVIFGGNHPDRGKIPVDFLSSVTGQGARSFSPEFPGESSNAAGAHFGLFDVGFDRSFKNCRIEGYYQKPIADGSGFRGIFNMEHDQIIGLNYVSARRRGIHQVNATFVKTDHQSGAGMPDLVYSVKIPSYSNPVECMAFLKEHFGIQLDDLSKEAYKSYLIEYVNRGNSSGGRDNYYNNGLYYMGNSFHSRAVGSPLFTTRQDMQWGSDYEEVIPQGFFVNNRVRAIHLGIAGYLSKRLSYRLLYTMTKNYGTYADWYGGSFSWNEQEDYYFKGGKEQDYALLEFGAQLRKRPVQITVSFGLDAGALYRNSAVQLSYCYTY